MKGRRVAGASGGGGTVGPWRGQGPGRADTKSWVSALEPRCLQDRPASLLLCPLYSLRGCVPTGKRFSPSNAPLGMGPNRDGWGRGAYDPPWEHSVPLVHQASPSGEVVTRQKVMRGCPRGGREEGGRAGDGAQRGLGQERGRCVAGGEGRVVPSRSSSCPDPWPRSPLPGPVMHSFPAGGGPRGQCALGLSPGASQDPGPSSGHDWTGSVVPTLAFHKLLLCARNGDQHRQDPMTLRTPCRTDQ